MDESRTINQEEWICTDPDCNQYRKYLGGNSWVFKEDRIINPETKEIGIFECEIDLDDYTWWDIVDYCMPFGFKPQEIDKWLVEGVHYEYMAEMIFELQN